jgi:nicotinate-nucleotide adenylyltransferase
MTLAILGGTFNPVHVGHLFLAQEVQNRLRYERILFVPANIPVHKDMPQEPGSAHRLEMLRLALSSHPGFAVEECELRRGGDSYSIDTVRYVLEHYPVDGKPGLIIGDDLVAGFDSWKESERLAGMVDLIVGRRLVDSKVTMRYPCVCVDNSVLAVSSSQVRDRLAQGRSVRHLVPEAVLRYIEDHGLYR